MSATARSSSCRWMRRFASAPARRASPCSRPTRRRRSPRRPRGEMRELHTRMLEAVLDGDGLRGVAELASAEARGSVAIVLPARGLAARAPDGSELNGLAEYARRRLEDGEATPPQPIAHEAAVVAGGEQVGIVVLLDGDEDAGPELPIDREEVLRVAAMAAMAEVAVADAREEA